VASREVKGFALFTAQLLVVEIILGIPEKEFKLKSKGSP
jgi:hypothetical protein